MPVNASDENGREAQSTQSLQDLMAEYLRLLMEAEESRMVYMSDKQKSKKAWIDVVNVTRPMYGGAYGRTIDSVVFGSEYVSPIEEFGNKAAKKIIGNGLTSIPGGTVLKELFDETIQVIKKGGYDTITTTITYDMKKSIIADYDSKGIPIEGFIYGTVTVQYVHGYDESDKNDWNLFRIIDYSDYRLIG